MASPSFPSRTPERLTNAPPMIAARIVASPPIPKIVAELVRAQAPSVAAIARP